MKNANSLISKIVLGFLNILFHVIHLLIIFFYIFGWMMPETRMAHYILALLILFSWFGLGIFYGFGYCLVTDIQWKIKKKLGQDPGTEYYVKYAIDKVTGLNTNPKIINVVTSSAYFGILIISTILFFRNFSFPIR